LLLWSGIKAGGDTGIYLDGATALLSGQALTERQPSYLGYIAVVAAFQAAGAGLTGVVVGQLAAATAAAWAVYRMAVEIGGRLAGGLAVLLFAVDVNTNRWHAYILSDSLFMSFLTVAVWLVYRAAAAGGPWRRYLWASVALVVAGLIRPEGWFVVPAAIAYWVAKLDGSAGRRLTMLAGGALACAALYVVIAPRLGGNLEAVGPAEMLRRGQTIWDYDGWRVPMPDDAAGSSRKGSAAAVMYAVCHPLSTATLMSARLVVHLAHVRPFYSAAHNIMIAAWLLPVYAFAAAGVWRARRQALVWWCGIAVATQALVVALTHADWDGRYLGHVMPLIYPCAACGLAALLHRAVPTVHDKLATL
jgi:4-amino-4-deoxy-L-arabinose transferase-like glycosyltransferase